MDYRLYRTFAALKSRGETCRFLLLPMKKWFILNDLSLQEFIVNSRLS